MRNILIGFLLSFVLIALVAATVAPRGPIKIPLVECDGGGGKPKPACSVKIDVQFFPDGLLRGHGITKKY